MYRRLLLLIVPLVIALLAVPTASGARVFKVNWKERETFKGGHMSFRVTRIVVDRTKWTVKAAFTNRSRRTIHVSTSYPTFQTAGMSLAYPSPTFGDRNFGGWTILPYRSAKPRIPARLGPGKTWSGTFGGFGVLPKRKLISVAFGWFEPDGRSEEGFNWVTVNAFKLPR